MGIGQRNAGDTPIAQAFIICIEGVHVKSISPLVDPVDRSRLGSPSGRPASLSWPGTARPDAGVLERDSQHPIETNSRFRASADLRCPSDDFNQRGYTTSSSSCYVPACHSDAPTPLRLAACSAWHTLCPLRPASDRSLPAHLSSSRRGRPTTCTSPATAVPSFVPRLKPATLLQRRCLSHTEWQRPSSMPEPPPTRSICLSTGAGGSTA